MRNGPAPKRSSRKPRRPRARASDAADCAILDRGTARRGGSPPSARSSIPRTSPHSARSSRPCVTRSLRTRGIGLEELASLSKLGQGHAQPPGGRQAGQPDRRHAPEVRPGTGYAAHPVTGAANNRDPGDFSGPPGEPHAWTGNADAASGFRRGAGSDRSGQALRHSPERGLQEIPCLPRRSGHHRLNAKRRRHRGRSRSYPTRNRPRPPAWIGRSLDNHGRGELRISRLFNPGSSAV